MPATPPSPSTSPPWRTTLPSRGRRSSCPSARCPRRLVGHTRRGRRLHPRQDPGTGPADFADRPLRERRLLGGRRGNRGREGEAEQGARQRDRHTHLHNQPCRGLRQRLHRGSRLPHLRSGGHRENHHICGHRRLGRRRRREGRTLLRLSPRRHHRNRGRGR